MFSRVRAACALLAVGGLLSACSIGGVNTDAAPGLDTGTDVVSAVRTDPSIANLLPPQVRQSGVLTIGSSVGTPPSAFYLTDNHTVVGQDIDIADAVARVLGLRVNRQEAAFEAILPALNSGKFQVGTGNFGVTEARKQAIDFVTYIDDGQGFAVRQDSPLPDIHDLTQLCGHTVGTSAGTTFETTLSAQRGRCAQIGKPPYSVQVFSEQSAMYSALQQGKVDVLMSTTNGLRYATSEQPNLRFRNEFHRLDVGFALPKNSPLAPALQAAVNKLIADGTYQRILHKYRTEASAIPRSEINPPEHR